MNRRRKKETEIKLDLKSICVIKLKRKRRAERKKINYWCGLKDEGEVGDNKGKTNESALKKHVAQGFT